MILATGISAYIIENSNHWPISPVNYNIRTFVESFTTQMSALKINSQ